MKYQKYLENEEAAKRERLDLEHKRDAITIEYPEVYVPTWEECVAMLMDDRKWGCK